MIKASTLESGQDNVVGAIRELTFDNDEKLRESLTAYDTKNHSYSYTILGDEGLQDYNATISVAPGDTEHSSKFSWETTFQCVKEYEKRQYATIEKVFKDGLDYLVSQ